MARADSAGSIPLAQDIDFRSADWLERELLGRAANRTRAMVFSDLLEISTGNSVAPDR